MDHVPDYHKRQPAGRSRPTPDQAPDPLWYPTFEVDDSPASTPPRMDMPDRVGECRVNLDTWGQRSILMPKLPAIIAPKRSN